MRDCMRIYVRRESAVIEMRAGMWDDSSGSPSDGLESRSALRTGGLAHFHLANLYAEGQACATNTVRAAMHFRQAALLGHAEAQFCLASRYASGLGIMQDALQADYWFHQAARNGHPGALKALADALCASTQS